MKDMESNATTLLPEAMRLFTDANTLTPHLNDIESKLSRKLEPNLKQAILDSGLKNGMTISFHHAFRGGDKVVNLVLDMIASIWASRTLPWRLAALLRASILRSFGHIKNGVVTKIATSGIRGELTVKPFRMDC
ncbi:citrate lyase subunit alpha [Vibrio sp. M60_M31a]